MPDSTHVEDTGQEASYELVEANRLLMPIDRVTEVAFSRSVAVEDLIR
jgi:hypothetical protein